jgi:hypothetical protein
VVSYWKETHTLCRFLRLKLLSSKSFEDFHRTMANDVGRVEPDSGMLQLLNLREPHLMPKRNTLDFCTISLCCDYWLCLSVRQETSTSILKAESSPYTKMVD